MIIHLGSVLPEVNRKLPEVKSTRKLPVGGDSILSRARNAVKHRHFKMLISQYAGRGSSSDIAESGNLHPGSDY